MLKYPGISKQIVKDSFRKSFQKFIHPYKRVLKISDKKVKKEKVKPVKEVKHKTIVLSPKETSSRVGELKLNGVYKRFDKVLALNGVDLAIQPKKISGIIGVSGSGKTTLLKTLVGFYKPTKGKITYKNKDLKTQINDIRRNFGFATQDDSFYSKLTVEENLKYFGRLYGLTNKFLVNQVDSLLKLVELDDSRKSLAGNLSTGMKRRLDIACALINDPKVLILDEPTQDLDPALRREVLDLIKKINRNGTTVIFTTHLLWEAEVLCDSVAILNEGRLLTVGSPDKIRKKYVKGDEIHLETHPGNYKKLLKGIKGIKVKKQDHKVVISTSKAKSVLQKILSRINKKKEKLIDVSVRKPHLEEVFEVIVSKDVKKKTSKAKKRK